MGDRKSKEERKAEREEKRAKRRERDIARHTVNCPHCEKQVLDHMTKCPHCGGELDPKGYRPPNARTMKISKIVGYTVFIVAAVVAVALWLILK